MAEGWAKKNLSDAWEIRSAGIEAHGVNPNAVKAMNEAGIDILNHTLDIIGSQRFKQCRFSGYFMRRRCR